MKIGLENKKQVYWLVGLGVVAAYLVYTNLLSGPPSYTPPPVTRSSESADAAAAAAERPPAPDTSSPATPARTRPVTNEFHPKIRPKKPDDRIADITKVDPKIRFDYMEAAMKVPPAGGKRDLFQIGKAPPIAEVKRPTEEVKVFRNYGPIAPPPPVQLKPPGPPPPPPPPPPIPLKYYGVSTVHPDGTRTAYISDGEEIYEAKEGTLIKNRYRVVQISVEKIMVEDTVEKRRQAVNMEPEAAG